MNLLKAENLSKRYFRKNGGANHFFAVKDVSLELRPGEVTLLGDAPALERRRF